MFEIKCLSDKFSIMVNKKVVDFTDKPVTLYHKSTISIGSENLTFYLPRNE